MDIILGKEQEDAITSIINFLKNSKDIGYSLVGYAGTGKSTIIKWLVEYLEKEYIEYVLAAPTHQAKSMIKYTTGLHAITIHQLLHLTPNIEIQNLDLRDLIFSMKGKDLTEIPSKGVIIADESSMINDVLFDFMIKEATKRNSKIIFVGDSAQLKPVKSQIKSLVFNLPDRSELTTIYRQSSESGLTTVLPVLRENIISKFNDSIGEQGSLICTANTISLFKSALPVFREAIDKRNIFGAKFYAYTNARVGALNDKIRSLLFPGEEHFYKGEILTFYDNFSYGHMDYWNSVDYIISNTPTKHEKYIPGFEVVDGYMIDLYDTLDNIEGSIFVLDPDTPYNILSQLGSLIENTRVEAIDNKYSNRKKAAMLWKQYYDITKSFATFNDLFYQDRLVKKKTFNYGYASTIHKA
jgi:hypothetical protein